MADTSVCVVKTRLVLWFKTVESLVVTTTSHLHFNSFWLVSC